MIDRDDRESGGSETATESSDENTVDTGPAEQDAGEDTPDAEPETEATEAGEAAVEEQPAMPLTGQSDEGGTVEEDSLAVDASSMDEPSAEPRVEDEAPVEDGAQVEDYEEQQAYDEEELGLMTDDDSLPWLESSDYDDIESVDAWRITGFVVMGLVFLALLIGGIWYLTNRGDAGEPVADGSTIAAPDTPYKERPEDPGGKTFEGTGDMAPAVGEGETREGRLAEKSATPEPVASEPAKAEEPEDAPAAPAANDSRIAVQVGAYRDKATAEEGWRQINRQTDALSGVQYRIVKGEADIGTVYRLQALPGDMAAARRLADALKADGVASQIKQ